MNETALAIDLLDGLQRPDSFTQAWFGTAVVADVVGERCHLQCPRRITPGIFENDRFWRPHLWKHLIEGEPLRPVATAQAIYRQLAVPPVEFEREEIFPFGAAHV